MTYEDYGIKVACIVKQRLMEEGRFDDWKTTLSLISDSIRTGGEFYAAMCILFAGDSAMVKKIERLTLNNRDDVFFDNPKVRSKIDHMSKMQDDLVTDARRSARDGNHGQLERVLREGFKGYENMTFDEVAQEWRDADLDEQDDNQEAT